MVPIRRARCPIVSARQFVQESVQGASSEAGRVPHQTGCRRGFRCGRDSRDRGDRPDGRRVLARMPALRYLLRMLQLHEPRRLPRAAKGARVLREEPRRGRVRVRHRRRDWMENQGATRRPDGPGRHKRRAKARPRALRARLARPRRDPSLRRAAPEAQRRRRAHRRGVFPRGHQSVRRNHGRGRASIRPAHRGRSRRMPRGPRPRRRGAGRARVERPGAHRGIRADVRAEGDRVGAQALEQ